MSRGWLRLGGRESLSGARRQAGGWKGILAALDQKLSPRAAGVAGQGPGTLWGTA